MVSPAAKGYKVVNYSSRTLDPEIPVHVVTYGGSGSKMILTWLYAGKGITYQELAHHHWRSRPHGLQRHHRIVYIFCDPRDAIVSFFQRRVSRHERHGFLPSRKRTEFSAEWTREAARNLELDPSVIDSSWDLETFVLGGVDLFRLEDHFDRWVSYAQEIPVTFVKYETLWEHVEVLAGLFCGDARSFPKFVPRRARWQDESPLIRNALCTVYGPFAEKLAASPPVFNIENGVPVPLVRNEPHE